MLPLRDTVVFPEVVVPILVGKARSRRLVTDLLEREETLLGPTAAQAQSDEPGPDELHDAATRPKALPSA